MSATAYVYVRRDSHETVDLPPLARTLCVVGSETARQTAGPAFRAYPDDHSFAYWLGARGPHARGGFWPNHLERGYRPLRISYDEADVHRDFGVLLLSRADVVEELDPADIYAIYAPPPWQTANSLDAYDSMQQPMS